MKNFTVCLILAVVLFNSPAAKSGPSPAVIVNCSEFSLKSTPNDGIVFFLECADSLKKDLQYLDESELANRALALNSSKSISQKEAICDVIKLLNSQIVQLEIEIKSSPEGKQKIEEIREIFSKKVTPFNCGN